MSGIPSWARKGVKVEVIRWSAEDLAVAVTFGIVPLGLGDVYTIRQCIARPAGLCLLLEEISNEGSPFFDFEMAYDIDRFRPLVFTKSEAEDVALFRDLITQPVDA